MLYSLYILLVSNKGLQSLNNDFIFTFPLGFCHECPKFSGFTSIQD